MLPTEQGQISVFPHHAPLVSVAAPGVVKVRKRATDPDDKLETYVINGGVIEINDKRVRLLADEAEHAEEIDATHAAAALQRARKMLAEADSQVHMAEAQALIERQIARIKVAELKRRHR